MKEVEVKGTEGGKLISSAGHRSGNATLLRRGDRGAWQIRRRRVRVWELNFIDSTTLGTFVKILKR
ncbi:MAG: hypothetical protein ACLRSW_07615 [Christensenellaceae bacterium]